MFIETNALQERIDIFKRYIQDTGKVFQVIKDGHPFIHAAGICDDADLLIDALIDLPAVDAEDFRRA